MERFKYRIRLASFETTCKGYNCCYKQLKRLEFELKVTKADRAEALKQLEFVRTLNTVKEAEIRKLSKTLTEIKEIAEKRNYLDYNECLDDILQKISEVENET